MKKQILFILVIAAIFTIDAAKQVGTVTIPIKGKATTYTLYDCDTLNKTQIRSGVVANKPNYCHSKNKQQLGVCVLDEDGDGECGAFPKTMKALDLTAKDLKWKITSED